jgi:hypothetical protein
MRVSLGRFPHIRFERYSATIIKPVCELERLPHMAARGSKSLLCFGLQLMKGACGQAIPSHVRMSSDLSTDPSALSVVVLWFVNGATTRA